jgi:hypothetical protein
VAPQDPATEPDTILTVPARNWSAAIQLHLQLEGAALDIEQLADQLLVPAVFQPLDDAIDIARPPEWSARQLREALRHLQARDYVLAWPLLVTAVEGLYWEEAESKGLLDPETSKILDGPLAGQVARDAHDIFRTLPMREPVRRAMSRYAFGSEANAFRHGRQERWGERQQCAIWILALITWFDGAGWRHFPSPA